MKTSIYLGMPITSGFEERTNPLTHREEFHRGIDTINKERIIYAILPGYTTYAGSGRYGEGIYCQVKSIIKGITFYTNYFHNQENKVLAGDGVLYNQLIAIMGSTGSSTAVHSHVEIFTYAKDSKLVKQLIKDKSVDHYDIPKRVFFNPIQFIKYMDKKRIKYQEAQ